MRRGSCYSKTSRRTLRALRCSMPRVRVGPQVQDPLTRVVIHFIYHVRRTAKSLYWLASKRTRLDVIYCGDTWKILRVSVAVAEEPCRYSFFCILEMWTTGLQVFHPCTYHISLVMIPLQTAYLVQIQIKFQCFLHSKSPSFAGQNRSVAGLHRMMLKSHSYWKKYRNARHSLA